MLTGFDHDYLWTPDEPREAEIARETLVDSHWVTPHLCGLPFLEKPPLYYDIIALAYRVTGSITPPVARSISLAFGASMLVVVFLLARTWSGIRRAWIAVLLLLVMPCFYRYSHFILLDIAVGAFGTLGLACFAWRFMFPCTRRTKGVLLSVFYLACAGAFLTKGLIGLFHIVIIAGAFILLSKRRGIIPELLLSPAILLFIIPVGGWVGLYYREGGLAYLREHFINNTVGRFLRIHFTFGGRTFYHTDLGNSEPWHFYLGNLPRMIGAVLAVLPFAVWETINRLRGKARELSLTKQPASQNSPSYPDSSANRQFDLLLLLWAFVPVLILSFSAIKETSYILPSYSALALLAAGWLDNLLPREKTDLYPGLGWLVMVLPAAGMSVFFSAMGARNYVILSLSILLPASLFIWLHFRKEFLNTSFFAVCAVSLCAIIIYHSPNVLSGQGRCDLPFARRVWAAVGDHQLYIYKPRDEVRGTLALVKNRLTPEIDRPEEVTSILQAEKYAFVLMDIRLLEAVRNDPTWSLSQVRCQSLWDDNNRQYALLSTVGG